MTPVEFERMLSFRPVVQITHGPITLAGYEQPTVRDMAFDYYCKMLQDTDRANAATKQWTDALYQRFVTS